MALSSPLTVVEQIVTKEYKIIFTSFVYEMYDFTIQYIIIIK